MQVSDTGETIVVIEEDESARLRCSWTLSHMGYCVYAFEDGTQGLEAATRLKPDAVIVGLRLSDLSAADVISCVRNMYPQATILAMTAYPTDEAETDALRVGADGLLVKPIVPEELRSTLQRELYHHRSIASAG